MIRFDHPQIAPDLTLYDFWLFGIWTTQIKDNKFRNADKVEEFVYNFWSDVTLEEVQPVFHEQMRRIKWVSEHDGEHFPDETWS
jgi:hypothetical protein